MSLQIAKHKNRFVSEKFLNYIRSLPCCICGAPSTPSHMKSVKFADGSDALAVPACIVNGHHVSSTRTSRKILERAGIDIAALHRRLWGGFGRQNGLWGDFRVECDIFLIAQHDFEELLAAKGLGSYGDGSKRKNRKEFTKQFTNPFV